MNADLHKNIKNIANIPQLSLLIIAQFGRQIFMVELIFHIGTVILYAAYSSKK